MRQHELELHNFGNIIQNWQSGNEWDVQAVQKMLNLKDSFWLG